MTYSSGMLLRYILNHFKLVSVPFVIPDITFVFIFYISSTDFWKSLYYIIIIIIIIITIIMIGADSGMPVMC